MSLIHHQAIICCVAVVRSSLRRITPYASVVAPRRLTSAGLLVVVKNPVLPHGVSSKEKAILSWGAVWRTNDVRWRTNDVRWRTNDVRWLQALMAIHPRSSERAPPSGRGRVAF
jgi:hypothetical protein